MENFKLGRNGYRFEHEISVEGNKRKVVIFQVSGLKGSRNKGVQATIYPTTIEQGDGYTSESFLLYNGANVSEWVEILPRMNDKKITKAAEGLDKVAPLIMSAYLEDPAKGRLALQQAIQTYRGTVAQ